MPLSFILFILLDVGLPIASWLAIVISIMLTLLGFLLRDAYNRLTGRITRCEVALEVLSKEQVNERIRNDKQINDLHLTILGKLDDIKKQFSEIRK